MFALKSLARKGRKTKRRAKTTTLRNRSGYGPQGKVSLRRIPLDRGGYTKSGRYYGVGAPLFEASDDLEWSDEFRAADRKAARAKILARYPATKFTR